MDEQMIELMAREIIVHNRQMVGDQADYAYADQILASDDAGDAGEAFAARELARAAHSVIAGKVAELERELVRVQAAAFGIRAEEIDAALAPYPERRSE